MTATFLPEAESLPDQADLDTADEVADQSALFLYSGMVDALRDIAGGYVHVGATVPAETVADLTTRYRTLRPLVLGALSPQMAEFGRDHTPTLDDGTPGLHDVHVALVLLARWSDLVHQTGNHLAQMSLDKVNRTLKVAASTRRGAAQLAFLTSGVSNGALPDQDSGALPGVRDGQYL